MIARVTGRLGARGSGVGARESISERGWVVPAAFVLLAAVEGAAVAYVPAVGIGLAAGTFVMAAVVASDQPASRLFLGLLLALLTGYMFLGRGLAHVGVGPAYVGDVVLVAAVLVLVFALARPARFDVLHGLLIVYILLGAALTVPYLGAYGLDALRDGVTWIYALFAIAVSVIVLPAHFERITAWYRRILPLFLLWVPLAYYLDQIGTPALPGSDVSAVVFKGGDIGVHLAGVAAFILLGLATTPGAGGNLRQALLWVLWLVDVAVAGAVNRGGLLAASIALVAVIFGRSSQRLMVLVLVGFSLLMGAALINPTVDTAAKRDISLGQIVDNVGSIFSSSVGPDSLQGSKEFRLNWWGAIVDYTVNGPYFWTGKGFGINLADSDGFQTDGTLRAPHNSHMTILAREGVPGLILWLALQAIFGWRLLRAGYRALSDGRIFLVQMIGWLFVYWLAALVNMSFDVYLESPQGGVWFWVTFGLGIAAIGAEVASRPSEVARRVPTQAGAQAQTSGA
ncbi:MAG: O-antigen ligase family protein [Chloroflexi bacterium]|nr:MAG: O-antigen ligase family protein [Chloroflexota bacterium]